MLEAMTEIICTKTWERISSTCYRLLRTCSKATTWKSLTVQAIGITNFRPLWTARVSSSTTAIINTISKTTPRRSSQTSSALGPSLRQNRPRIAAIFHTLWSRWSLRRIAMVITADSWWTTLLDSSSSPRDPELPWRVRAKLVSWITWLEIILINLSIIAITAMRSSIRLTLIFPGRVRLRISLTSYPFRVG